MTAHQVLCVMCGEPLFVTDPHYHEGDKYVCDRCAAEPWHGDSYPEQKL